MNDTVIWVVISILWAVAYFWRTWLWSIQKERIESLETEVYFRKDSLDSAVRAVEDMKELENE